MAKQTGALPSASVYDCIACGREASCYDHANYTEPHIVAPVCAACNIKLGAADIDVEVVKQHIFGALSFYSYRQGTGFPSIHAKARVVFRDRRKRAEA